LVLKVEEIYVRTKKKVKVGEKEGEWFKTTKGVRQGCPLNPGCGNEERENKYWTEEEERRCGMCREESETIEHMWSGCNEMRERERKDRGEILSEDGREIGWMKEIFKRRERTQTRMSGGYK
jgi:hypothetical protein